MVKIKTRKIIEALVYALIFLYTLFFSRYTIERHRAFLTYAWDLGIFNQAMYTTVKHGKFLYYALETHVNPSNCFFGIHFSPILLLILPFYAIKPGPETLLVIQSALIALGALPVYWLGRDMLNDEIDGLALATSYLLYPALHGVNCFDFHIEAFIPSFLLFAIYFFLKERWKAFFFFLFLTLMCLEQASFLVLLLGFYASWYKRGAIISYIKRRNKGKVEALVPIITIFLALSWLLLSNAVQGFFNPNPPAELKAGHNWEILGVEGPTQIPIAVLKSPNKAIKAISYDLQAKLAYIVYLLAPLLFLPILSPSMLVLNAPFFAFSLLSNYRPYYYLGLQYPAIAVPFLFGSAILGIKRCIGARRALVFLVLVSSVLHSAMLSPVSPVALAQPWTAYYKPFMARDHIEDLYKMIDLIPEQASVLTVNSIFPHVSSRMNAYCIPPWHPFIKKYNEFVRRALSASGGDEAEFILLDLKYSEIYGDNEFLMSWVLENRNYSVYAYSDSIFLFRRWYKGEPIFLRPMRLVLNYKNLHIRFGSNITDPTSESSLVLVHRKQDDQGTFFFGPYVTLPPGNYVATFRLKVDELGSGHLITIEAAAELGIKVFASHEIDLSEFKEAGLWQDFVLEFSLDVPVRDVEFRGIYASNLTTIYLDYIEVVRTG